MSSKPATLAFAAAAILGAALSATAQQPPGAAAQQAKPVPPAAGPAKGTPRQSQLPGDELFTPEERRAFFDRMKAAQTPEERAKIQAERRATAEARAKEKGITLPPPPGPAPGAPKAQ
jgi:Spy/CpxP family protein refolding chaperone